MRIRNILPAIGMGILLTACSGDYLDTVPEHQTGPAIVFETTELAEMAVNGMAKLMNTYFYYPDRTAPKTTDFNGEGTIKMLYGNWMGNHFVCSAKDGFATLFKGSNYMSNTSSIYCYYPWWYYYMVIGNANTIIANIAQASGPEADRRRIRAQALTFRAYSYTMLAQFYGKRWKDSQDGNSAGVVLRLDESMGSAKLCTLRELYKQVYDDLDEAIRLFEASGYERKAAQNYLPDLRVAYAAYARAALNREDYRTASSMAAKACEGIRLMDAADYRAGFNTPNAEWIWSSNNSGSESVGQYSFFAKIAYNSRYAEAYKMTKCISRELYNRIPETDIRRRMFLDPGELAYNDTVNGLAGKELAQKARTLFPGIFSDGVVYAYMQFKFRSLDNAGAGSLCHFRASEMYLVKAEAEYFLNEEDAARKILIALTKESGRDEAYTCEKSGQALLEEIKLYRAIELWGEGFDWFDMKRWGDTIHRKSFNDGGNFTVSTGFVTRPEENSGWCWQIPDLETDYNDEVAK